MGEIPPNAECHVFGRSGRFFLYVGDSTDPTREAGTALELEQWALALGAKSVTHYAPGLYRAADGAVRGG